MTLVLTGVKQVTLVSCYEIKTQKFLANLIFLIRLQGEALKDSDDFTFS